MTKEKITKNHGRLKKWLIALAAIVLVAIVALWPTNYYLETPGNAFQVGQFVKSKKKAPNNLYLVTVSMTARPATLAQYLWSYTQEFDERISAKELLGGQTSSQYEELQEWYMETSQQNAIYTAAKKAGLKPKLSYYGVYVMGVQNTSSFKGKLQIGDTIVGANGHHFKSQEALMKYLQSRKLGSKVTIQIIRNRQKKTYSGKIVKVKGTNKPGIGISLVERVKVKTSPKVTINAGDIGGPSAGLMFTLECYQVFTGKNLTKGHKVAGTGTIAANGKVGIIGGVDKKVVAASKAGCEVFFAPTDMTGLKKKSQTNYAEAKRTAKKIKTKMKIVPVANVDDALNYLAKHYQ